MKKRQNILQDFAFFIETKPKTAKIFYSEKYLGIRTCKAGSFFFLEW